MDNFNIKISLPQEVEKLQKEVAEVGQKLIKTEESSLKKGKQTLFNSNILKVRSMHLKRLIREIYTLQSHIILILNGKNQKNYFGYKRHTPILL